MFTIKVQVIQNTAHRPRTQASYTIGSGTTMQENQSAAQIAAEHNISPHMAPYMSWIFLVLVGIDPGVSRLGGEIVSHNTTDAQYLQLYVAQNTATGLFADQLLHNAEQKEKKRSTIVQTVTGYIKTIYV